MRKLNFRNIVTALLCGIMNRCVLMAMNPFGVACFAGACMYKQGRLLAMGMSIVGMATVLPFGILIKYVGVMAGIWMITKLAEFRKKVMKPLPMALLCGFLTGIAGFAYSAGLNGPENIQVGQLALLCVLEGTASFAMVFVFDHAAGIFLRQSDENVLSNEEQVSLGICAALCVYAFRDLLMSRYCVTESLILFALMYIGYCYGAGGGAIAGACIGSVMAYQQSDMSLAGFMAMLGIVAGAFRDKGRIISGLAFFAGVFVTGCIGVPWMLGSDLLTGCAAVVLAFVLLPESLAAKRVKAENPKNESEEFLTKSRLRAFSESFRKLAGTFNAGVSPRSILSKDEVDEAFDELTRNVCANCSRCGYCWERDYYETYNAASNILDYFSKNGDMARSELPLYFKKRCINIDRFLNETSRIVEVAKLNLSWKNRMMESRLAIAGQLGEVAAIIDDFSGELEENKTETLPETALLKQRLSVSKVYVKSLTVVKKPNGRRTVYMAAKMRRGRCISSKEVGEVISSVFGRDFVLAKGCRMVISKEMNTYEFVEDVRFKTMQGVARAAKSNEKVSGDSYTFLSLSGGQTIMSLSDGMGAGEHASEESSYIIELLEQLLDSGFGKQSAVRLINSMMFLKSGEKDFSTIDMSIIDLYSGVCEFVKAGASTTFIRHGNSVESIHSESLPVGAFTQPDCEGTSRQMEDNDVIIMISDGVLGNIDGENKEKALEDYIGGLPPSSPQEMANAVLTYALRGSGYHVNDDMTVLACGVYKT